jgi:hypothetical protein
MVLDAIAGQAIPQRSINVAHLRIPLLFLVLRDHYRCIPTVTAVGQKMLKDDAGTDRSQSQFIKCLGGQRCAILDCGGRGPTSVSAIRQVVTRGQMTAARVQRRSKAEKTESIQETGGALKKALHACNIANFQSRAR